MSIGVGLVGWGLSGRFFHASFIRASADFRLAAVVTARNVDRALFPDVVVLRSFEALLDHTGIDLVVIASPNRYHIPQAAAALRAGKHVVVEKPLAETVAQIDELDAIARTAGRHVIPFQNRRWDGDFLTIKALAREGTLGRVHYFGSRWSKYRPTVAVRSGWKAESDPMNGLLYDLGPHLIDQAIQLFGSPAAVFAQVRRLRPGTPGDDFIRLQLGYADGLWAELAIDQLNPFPTPRFQLRGTDGSFEKYGLDPQEEALCRGDFPGCPGWGEEPPEAWGTLWTPNGSHRIRTAPGDYSHFYRGVYRAIVAGAEPPVSLGDVRVQMQIISLALHSSERGTLERLDSPRSDSPSLSAGLACAK